MSGTLRRLAALLAGHARAGTFLVLGLPLGTFWLLVVLGLTLSGLALLPSVVGFPVLGLAVPAWVLAARTERWRAKKLLGTTIPSPYRSPPRRPLSRWLRTFLLDPAVWRDLAYVLALPLVGLAEALVFAVAFVLPWPLMTYPLWFRRLPEAGIGPGGGPDILLSDPLLAALIGAAAAVGGFFLVRRSAEAHRGLALALLGPASPRLTPQVVLALSSAALAAFLAVLAALPTAALLAGYAPADPQALWRILSSPQGVRELFKGFGLWAPLVFSVLQAAQVLVSVLPAAPLIVAGAAAFGPWWGFILSLCGAVFGSVVSFLLGRRFGRPMVVRLVGESTLDRYAGRMDARGWWIALVLLMPLPAGGDVVCAVAGLSEVSLARFALMVTLGRVPYTALAVLAATGLTSGSSGLLATAVGLLAIILAAGVAFLYWRRRAS